MRIRSTGLFFHPRYHNNAALPPPFNTMWQTEAEPHGIDMDRDDIERRLKLARSVESYMRAQLLMGRAPVVERLHNRLCLMHLSLFLFAEWSAIQRISHHDAQYTIMQELEAFLTNCAYCSAWRCLVMLMNPLYSQSQTLRIESRRQCT